MKLRTRTLFTVGSALLLCGAMTFGVSYLVFTRSLRNDAAALQASLDAEDEAAATRGLRAFTAALQAELDGLERLVTAWARRDDTYAYVQTRSAAYRKANLADTVMDRERLDVLVIAAVTGRIVDRLSFDRDRGVFGDLPPSIPALLAPGSRLAGLSSPLEGVIALPEGVLLLAASPIQPANATGAPRGVYLVGRYLGVAESRALAEGAGVVLTLRAADASGTTEGVSREDRGYVAHAVIRDLDGRPVLVARIEPVGDANRTRISTLASMERSAMVQAAWLAVALLATLILVTGAALLVVELAVLRRTGELGARLEAIAADPRIGERVVARGDDELGLLETGVNEVLAALEVSRKDHADRARGQEAAARRARASLQATGQVAFELDTSAGRIHLEGALTRLTGYGAEELESVPVSKWELMIHPEDRAAATAAAEQAGVGPYRVEYRLKRKDGSWVTLEERGVRTSGPTGRVVGMLRAAIRHPQA